MTLLISNEEAPLRERRDPELLRGKHPALSGVHVDVELHFYQRHMFEAEKRTREGGGVE